MGKWKGDKANINKKGRPKGSKNKNTELLEGVIDLILGEGSEKFYSEMMKLEGKDFINNFKDLIEYNIPKLARKEAKEQVEEQVYKEPSIVIDGQELTVKH